MKVQLLAIAKQELDDAVAWYDEQSAGLGREFLDEIDRAVRRAAAFPRSCPEIEPDVRRSLVARFPYGVIFGLDQGALVIVAVAHMHREPRYWTPRLR